MVGERAQPAAQRRAEVDGGLLDRAFGRALGLFEPARVPQVDVEQLDLLDQEEDRAAGGPDLVPAIGQQTLAPCPQNLELVFVEPLRRQSLLGSACS